MTAIPRPPSIGRLHRFRLLQPCRFYAYGWLLSLAVGLLLIGALTSWAGPLLAVVALGCMVPGIEAAARSTVGPADVLRAYRNAQQ